MPVGLRVTGANGAAAGDGPAFDIVGDFDARVRLSLDDWTPGANVHVFGKWTETGDQRSWRLIVNATGNLLLQHSADGIAFGSYTSTAVVPAVNGATIWVRAVLDVDNGAAGRDALFYTSADGTNWAQLGTTVTTAGATTVFSSSAPVTLGSNGGGSVTGITGWVYQAQLRNSIDGTVVMNPDFRVARLGSAVYVDSTGTAFFLGAGTAQHNGSYLAGSEEALQAVAQRNHRTDLNRALRTASGIDKDANGVSQQLWGTDLYQSRDQAYVMLGGT